MISLLNMQSNGTPVFQPKVSPDQLECADDLLRYASELALLTDLYAIKQRQLHGVDSKYMPISRSQGCTSITANLNSDHFVNQDVISTKVNLMFQIPDELLKVLEIMTELATPLHLVPWMSITSLEIQMQSLLDYVFELVSFMPQLKKLRVSRLVLPETVVRNYDPDVPYNSEDDVDSDEDDMTQFQQKCSGHDERLDMTQYAAQLSKQYAPLRQSELTQLKLVYDGAVSAQCIILTHHLCKRFIPKLEDLRIKSTMHNLINGKWRCSYNWVCHYHGDKV